ncbi:hypothetical protein FGO68_gene2855 [Halteria grandinella]|uniref:Peptidyl-prolyl cis-trans isomerase n=1 Tax=Halteria grandinella TaxID=5974 RepID=A0A8J8SZB9_HALGN|nr:hypothetical protein FGO68_gene2855 [Halteria grandinella]
MTTVHATVFFDISIGGAPAGQMTFNLYADTPITSENFRALCTGEKGIGKSGKALWYKGSKFHKICPDKAQGGDITAGNGTGGESIYGAKFDNETFRHKHTRSGILTMVNSFDNKNESQFFITLEKTPWLDGKHVAFGEIDQGTDILQAIHAISTPSGAPTMVVDITNSGQL